MYKPSTEKERDRKKEEMAKPNKLLFEEMGVSDFQGFLIGLCESVSKSTMHIYKKTQALSLARIHK